MADPISKAMTLMCEELQALRDDIYDAAVIRDAEAFATSATSGGNFSILMSRMALNDYGVNSTPLAYLVYTNKSKKAAVVYVRVGPVTPAIPQAGFAMEQTLLLLDVDPLKVIDVTRAAVVHTGYGDGVAVVVGPESTLYAAIVASVTTTLTWRAIPLSGRAVLGGKDGL